MAAGARRYFNSIEIVDRTGSPASATTSTTWCRSANTCRSRPARESAHHPVRRHSRRLRAGRGAAASSRIPGLPDAMPLVCYEAIFPDEIGDLVSGAERPRWLLNVTDDAWFGRDAGSLSALRASPPARDRTRRCRWCATPIPGSPRSSTASAARSWSRRSARKASSTASCPRRSRRRGSRGWDRSARR